MLRNVMKAAIVAIGLMTAAPLMAQQPAPVPISSGDKSATVNPGAPASLPGGAAIVRPWHPARMHTEMTVAKYVSAIECRP